MTSREIKHSSVPKDPLSDTRIDWIKQKVQAGLMLEFQSSQKVPHIIAGNATNIPAQPELFLDCLERNGRENLQTLVDYLDDTAGSMSALIWWVETKTVQVDTIVPVKSVSTTALALEDMVPATEQPLEQAVGVASGTAHELTLPSIENAIPDGSAPIEETAAQKSVEITAAAPIIESLVYEILVLNMANHNFPEELSDLNAVYFLRNSSGPVPFPRSAQDDTINSYLGIGYFSNSALRMLEQSLQEIYLPFLSQLDFGSQGTGGDRTGGSGKFTNLKADLLVTIQKFSSHISNVLTQVSGETRLKIPDMLLDIATRDHTTLRDDRVYMRQLENLAEEWIEVVANTIAKEVKKVPNGNSALAEIEYWRDRTTSLSTLYEQLNLPIVTSIVRALNTAQVPSASSLEFQLSELNKIYDETKDNVKFLGTLERHFKNFISASLGNIQDSLPSLMNAIRMVWIISRHYNRDERMVPLMSRIAWEISNKVSNAINVQTILRDTDGSNKEIIRTAQSLLEAWSATYFQVREKIEMSGRDQRWEFDRKKLFEQTNYMALRCADLHEIAEVMEQFNSIFGPELKAVTGDPAAIDEVIKRVEALVVPLENIPFDLFNKRYQTQWETVIGRFREQIVQIEDMAKQFIDASFKKLRSAEGAFDLLQNIKNIKSRESINKQLMGKWYEILDQYGREVDIIEDIFLKNKDKPPYSKNQPKVAGAIAWSHSLFERIKHTIVRFQSLKEMLASDQGRAVTRKYLAVAKNMRNYEEQLYHQWALTVEANALQYLKKNILLKDTSAKKLKDSVERATVNFRPELKEIIKETKYLDKLGLAVPEAAMNVALQDDKYYELVENLRIMLNSYYGVMDSLDAPEKKLLTVHIAELGRVLKPGFTRLNWNSLGIPEFLVRCNNVQYCLI